MNKEKKILLLSFLGTATSIEKTKDLAIICSQISNLYLKTNKKIKAKEYKEKSKNYLQIKKQYRTHNSKF